MKIWKNLFGKNDKIDANEIFVTHGLLLPEVVIIESGNYSYGRYAKWGDGTMEQQGSFVVKLNMTRSAGSLYRQANNTDIPQVPVHPDFIEVPSKSYGTVAQSENSDLTIVSVNEQTNKTIVDVYSATSQNNCTFRISYQFKGRWK